MSTAVELDRDGFTPAEQAYFASQGQNTEGLADDVSSDAAIPQPIIDKAAEVAVIDPKVDPASDPFDELEKVATDNRGKTGKVIPEANFRAVSEKYKLTKSERDTLRTRLEAVEADAKAAREETAKEREMRTRIDERLKLFNEVIAPQADAKPEKPAMPNPEEDIFGAFKWLAEHSAAEIAELKGQIGQTAQTVQDTTAETQLRSTYQADAQRFMGETPDFGDAYNHVNKVRDAMLESIGYSDPKQRAQIRMDEERALVAQALQSGKSPAATIYGVAKSLGYAKAAPQAAAVPAASTPAQAAPSVIAEIENIQKGQAASKSLSSGGGSAVAPMDMVTLAAMTDDEFADFGRKNPQLMKELMGG